MSAKTELNEAKQLYIEQFGEALVTGSYLKVAAADAASSTSKAEV